MSQSVQNRELNRQRVGERTVTGPGRRFTPLVFVRSYKMIISGVGDKSLECD
jgi:hypothetical protein